MAMALIRSVAIYGSESWTLRSKEEKYIEAFENVVLQKAIKNSVDATQDE